MKGLGFCPLVVVAVSSNESSYGNSRIIKKVLTIKEENIY
jgi:hypothetical protein